MDLDQFLCQEGQEKYEKAIYLNDTESQNDPETEPFKSKYKAREIWFNLKETVEKNTCTEPHTTSSPMIFLVAVLDYKIGTNYSETEELSSGQEHLVKCIDSLEPIGTNEKACNTLQMAYNQMGILWTTRRQPQKALEYLKKAETLYLNYKADVGSSPLIYDELFTAKNEDTDGSQALKRNENFEHCYTLTLYYLAQVYAKLEENGTSAKYCHITLGRQLETKKYDPIDWSLNAATLSQYYITISNRTLARHCLASSQRILLELGEPNLSVNVEGEDSQAEVDKKEKLPRCWADLYRCWIKYGLSLLEDSMSNLLEKARNEDTLDSDTTDHNADKKEPDESSSQADEQSGATAANFKTEKNREEENGDLSDESEDKKNNLFFDLELTSIEDQITDEYVLDFDQAKVIFLQVQKWINQAKEFYILDGHCTDHIELIQDHSKVFKLLAFFEMDFERQCKMHKRRIDMLLDIEKQLSTQYYLLVCRQLMYEIAETYSTMLDIKLAIIEEHGTPPTQHAVKKINALTEQSINMYNKYVDSLKSGPDKNLPEKFANDDERPALIAFFCMGRLYGKFLDFEPRKKLQDMKKSLECYKFLVDYCDKNESGRNVVKTEYEICSEMVTLMPYKMQKISAQIV